MSNSFKLPTMPEVPEVKFNKSGYEIRANILDLAKGLVTEDYQAKLYGWEVTSTRDAKTNQIVTKVAMPEFPGLDKILDTAEKMYAFVNKGTTSFKK